MLQKRHLTLTIQRSRGDAPGASGDSGAKPADARERQQDQRSDPLATGAPQTNVRDEERISRIGFKRSGKSLIG